MIRSIVFALVLVGAALCATSLPAEDVEVTYGDVSVCLSPPRDPIPVWGSQVAYLLVSNRGQKAIAFLDPEVETTDTPRTCGGIAGDPRPPDWTTVEPGTWAYRSWMLGSPQGGSLEQLGEHPFGVSVELDFDADRKADRTVLLNAKYSIVEPPSEVLTIAQERGVEVELCKSDGAGGARVKAIAIPWQDLENEQQARVRESIALPPPSMTPEEIAARGGRLPKPSDPDDQKRLEEALNTDPAYLRWETLRGKMGLYAGFDYASALETVRLLDTVPKERWVVQSSYFQDMYGPGLDRRIALGAGDSRRIQRTVAVFLEQGRPAALEYLDALTKEDLRCADRAFLEEVRAIVLAAP